MYTKQALSKQKTAFWTTFGRYMKPVLSEDGEPVSWLNYKTGNKYIHFVMDVDTRQAQIAVVVQHPDAGQQQAFYERLVQLKKVFHEAIGEDDWTWAPDSRDEQGRLISVIQKTLPGVNLFKSEDWPAIISFLKPRIIALDGFWSLVRYQFS